MGRRRSGLVNDLAGLPWWVGVLVGIGGYLLLGYGAPSLASGHPVLARPAQGVATFIAPLWLAFSLFGAALGGLKVWRTRRLYDKQRGQPNLASLSWQDFEHLVGEHFRRRGYHVIETGGSRPDGGIDLVLTRDRERYVVQCKHWKARQVGVSVVRELVGSITHSGAVGGFLVTSGTLSTPALALAQEAGIEVVDGGTLRADLGHQDSLDRSSAVTEQTPLRTAPTCPACGNPMVLRTARRGSQAGQQFWGCSSFPGCRGTRQLSEASLEG